VKDGAVGGAEPVRIEALAAGGDGVGRLADGMTVFVPRTAPRDLVRLAGLRRRRRHARAAAAEILEPGPDRVAPRCAHYDRDGCGGCQWQHITLEAQHRAKSRVVGDALRRIGALAVEDPPLVPSPQAFGYRTTVTLTVRWLSGGDGGGQGRVIAGFHHHADPDRVFALERCEIARPEIGALWGAVRSALGSLPHGTDVRLKLRVAGDGGLHVVVGGGEGAWTAPEPLERAAAGAGLAATVWWEPTGGAIRRMAGPAADRGAVAFAQVNPEVAERLRGAVLAAAPSPAGGRALDLYAGAGETAVALAAAGWEVASVEVNDAAVARAGERARATGVVVRAVAARVEDAVEGLLPARLVVANPPRGGLEERVAAALAARPPERLIYVSCDPATLARDLKRLGADAARLSVTCYDMFPQTAHVETVAVLREAGG
jgi:23S rRNA (uracil1939-C5)-methyltransferase